MLGLVRLFKRWPHCLHEGKIAQIDCYGATQAVQYTYLVQVHTSYNDAFATQMNMSVEHDIHSSFIASLWP